MRPRKKPLTKIEAVARELCRQEGLNPFTVIEFKKRLWTRYIPRAVKILRVLRGQERL